MVGAPQKSAGGSKLKMILTGVGGVLFAIVALVGVYYFYTHPSVYVVNVTGKDGVTVFIDGEPFAKDLKNAATESLSKVSIKTIASGSHKVEAKDASGKVLESFKLEFAAGLGTSYVYAPARDPKICFFIQADEYKTSPAAPSLIKDHFKPLDPTKTIWKITDTIDYWFQDSPDSVSIQTKKGSSAKSVVKRALRQAACNDPNFQG